MGRKKKELAPLVVSSIQYVNNPMTHKEMIHFYVSLIAEEIQSQLDKGS